MYRLTRECVTYVSRLCCSRHHTHRNSSFPPFLDDINVNIYVYNINMSCLHIIIMVSLDLSDTRRYLSNCHRTSNSCTNGFADRKHRYQSLETFFAIHKFFTLDQKCFNNNKKYRYNISLNEIKEKNVPLFVYL